MALGMALVLALGAGAYWVQRPHTLVYRASSTDCESEVRYELGEGRTGVVRLRGAWESHEVVLEHGEVAAVVVVPGPGCATVACELIEDGVRVAATEGQRGAVCSAATAR